MSHPDPMNDPENEREDDDLLRMEEDARRYEEMREASLKTAEFEDKSPVLKVRGKYYEYAGRRYSRKDGTRGQGQQEI